MLSIGKMVSGAEEYYLGIVASGREDYYTGAGEAPGLWLGAGSASLALQGSVGAGQLRVLLAGFSPTDGRRLTSRPVGAARVTGFDLTFSAPKSVSVLWGISGFEVSEAVRRGHDGAVTDALGYLERHATFARRGAGGPRRIGANGLVAAGFRHRTSRAGDPQLHTHVLVANAVCGEDGRWSALDARLLYFHARTAGFVYQAALRAQLVESLGVSFGPVENGCAEILGIDAELMALFATRRADIEAALQRRGEYSARAAQLVVLATRPPKATRDLAVSLGGEALTDSWRRRARGLGVGPEELRQALGRVRLVRLEDNVAHDLTTQLLGSQGLTAQHSSFERRDVVRGVAGGLRDGAPAVAVDDLVDRMLTTDDVIGLQRTGRGGEQLHTTRELLSIETCLLSTADAGRLTGTAVVAGNVLEDTLARRPSLSEEQRTAVRRLLSSGDGLEVVVGKAGSGKTMALEAARAAWVEAGFTVSGTALAARAAAELQACSGIGCDTVSAVILRLDRGEPVFGPKEVLVVDEAAMVGTRALAKLVDAARCAQAKVVLVGDHRQLPEIEAGGAFAALARRLGAAELIHNRRQDESWERTALDELRAGDVGLAVGAYQDRGRIHLLPSAADARRTLIGDWMMARQSGSDLRMFAGRRKDVEALNRLARIELKGEGTLGPDVAVGATWSFALTDEVICLHNDRRLGVRNGTTGRVASGGQGFVVISTTEGARRLDQDYLDSGWLAHGYATTIHKAQGATLERAFVLGTGSVFRESGYVAMSRARARTDLYVVDGAFETGIDRHIDEGPLAGFTRSLSESRAKGLAVDELQQREPGRLR